MRPVRGEKVLRGGQVRRGEGDVSGCCGQYSTKLGEGQVVALHAHARDPMCVRGQAHSHESRQTKACLLSIILYAEYVFINSRTRQVGIRCGL